MISPCKGSFKVGKNAKLQIFKGRVSDSGLLNPRWSSFKPFQNKKELHIGQSGNEERWNGVKL